MLLINLCSASCVARCTHAHPWCGRAPQCASDITTTTAAPPPIWARARWHRRAESSSRQWRVQAVLMPRSCRQLRVVNRFKFSSLWTHGSCWAMWSTRVSHAPGPPHTARFSTWLSELVNKTYWCCIAQRLYGGTNQAPGKRYKNSVMCVYACV